MTTQLKKGILDMLVLAMLEHSDRYGFELVERISTHVEIAERSIYPLLKRLRDDGYVTTYLEESDRGAPRKYYHITEPGLKHVREAKANWETIRTGVDRILSEAEREQS